MIIYQAIRKHGLENFDFIILEECLTEQLNEREVYWIAYFNSYKNGYNATEGGDESHIHLGHPVELYDLNGNYITEYPNITEAAKALGSLVILFMEFYRETGYLQKDTNLN